jgi:hypothetical protein
MPIRIIEIAADDDVWPQELSLQRAPATLCCVRSYGLRQMKFCNQKLASDVAVSRRTALLHWRNFTMTNAGFVAHRLA